jgi:transcription elongation GreA/GreB family factor
LSTNYIANIEAFEIQTNSKIDAPANSVTFAATVMVQDKKGATETSTIVGVDELDFGRDAVRWISSSAKRC